MWRKGQSGNPDGRPKKFKIYDYLGDEKIKVLVDVAYDKAKKGDKEMVKYLLDQGLGKAPQSMDVTTGGDKIIPIYGSLSRHKSDSQDIQPDQEDKGD